MTKTYYVDGNTVRVLGAEPARRPHLTPEEREEIRRRKARRNAARRNRERAMSMSRGSVLFLTLCVIVSAFAAVSCVQIRARITDRMKSITRLESQITDLKADNDARYKEITTAVDLDEVKAVATEKLGMKYAAEDQVEYYTVEKSSFMDQHSDIPRQ